MADTQGQGNEIHVLHLAVAAEVADENATTAARATGSANVLVVAVLVRTQSQGSVLVLHLAATAEALDFVFHLTVVRAELSEAGRAAVALGLLGH